MARGVVYTTNIGARDAALPRVAQQTVDADYVCFADPAGIAKHKDTSIWTMRDALTVDDCPIRAARFHKCCPHVVLPGYDWWIWVDGSTTLRGDMSELLTEDLVLLSHPQGRTLQAEFDRCAAVWNCAPSLLHKQHAAYVAAGVPMATLVPQTSVVARKNIGWVTAFNTAWWQEIAQYTPRDQLAIVPALLSQDTPPQYRQWSSVCGRLFDMDAARAHAVIAYPGYEHRAPAASVSARAALSWYQHVYSGQLPPPEYRFTEDWTVRLRRTLTELAAAGFSPKSMLEIGVSEAHGLYTTMQTLPSVREWTGVDPWYPGAPWFRQPFRELAEWNLRQLALRHDLRLRIFDTTSDDACGQLRQANEQFDLVYVDGDHSAAAALADSRSAWALVRPGGVVVWDDIPLLDGTTDMTVRIGFEQFLQEVGLTFDDANFDGWQCHLTKPA
jgi:hypothetical protein